MTQTAPEKPDMAAKKNFEFKIAHGKVEDIPATVRTGGMKLPFDFDSMKLGSHFHVPAEFWESRGITKSKNTAPLNKDRIRRSFYNWRDVEGKKERKKFALAFSDKFEGQEYKGTEVYLANAAN